MEIHRIDRPTRPAGLTKPLKKADNAAFREVLQARIAQTGSTAPATGLESKSALLAQSEKVLDLLDDFSQALADPHRSLKDLAPLLRRMEGEAKLLDPASGDEGDQDLSLSQVVSDVSLLANVTFIKFHRGDFI
jgi:hypothetical protein